MYTVKMIANGQHIPNKYLIIIFKTICVWRRDRRLSLKEVLRSKEENLTYLRENGKTLGRERICKTEQRNCWWHKGSEKEWGMISIAATGIGWKCHELNCSSLIAAEKEKRRKRCWRFWQFLKGASVIRLQFIFCNLNKIGHNESDDD